MAHTHFDIPMLYPMRFKILEALCDQLPVYQLKSSYLQHRRQLADQSESLTEYVQCHTECDAMAIERMQPGLLQRPEPMDLFESLLSSFVEAARLCHVMTPGELAQAMTMYGQMKHSYRAIKLNDLYKAHKASIQTMSVRTSEVRQVHHKLSQGRGGQLFG